MQNSARPLFTARHSVTPRSSSDSYANSAGDTDTTAASSPSDSSCSSFAAGSVNTAVSSARTRSASITLPSTVIG